MGGKTYWSVKGGRWSQFGVRIWPEVLEAAGFNAEELDPARVYDLKGHRAEIVLKVDGKPDKVTQLTKP
jgi:hypothetical protein